MHGATTIPMARTQVFVLMLYLWLSLADTTSSLVTQISSNYYHTCALHDNGDVHCFGDGTAGALLTGDTLDVGRNPGEIWPITQPVFATEDRPIRVATGDSFTCMIFNTDNSTEHGRVRCFGNNEKGNLGQDDSDKRGEDFSDLSSTPYIGFGDTHLVRDMACGEDFVCAIFSPHGKIRCWGAGSTGQLGTGDTSDVGQNLGDMSTLSYITFGTTHGAQSLDCSPTHCCAVFSNSRIRCWGDGQSGQLGTGNNDHIGVEPTDMSNLPFIDFGGLEPVIRVATGPNLSCAVFDDRYMKCWGTCVTGACGYGETTADEQKLGDEPGEIAALKKVSFKDDIYDVAMSDTTTCVANSSHVLCWGKADLANGRNDNNDHTDDKDDVKKGPKIEFADTVAVKQIETSEFGSFSCALFVNGGVRCWGKHNSAGATGLEADVDTSTAIRPVSSISYLRDWPVCGDGVVTAPYEECDDSNYLEGDGCGSDCRWDFYDACGVPLGDNSTCNDMCHIPHGDNSTCAITIDDVQPSSSLPIRGGGRIHVIGTGLHHATSYSIRLGTKGCGNVLVTNATHLSCELASGVGTLTGFELRGTLPTSNVWVITRPEVKAAYDSPVINSVVPLRISVDHDNTVVTLSGTNLGLLTLPPSVTIGGSPCSPVVVTHVDPATFNTQVTCIAPSDLVGLNHPVVATLSGVLSDPAADAVSYVSSQPCCVIVGGQSMVTLTESGGEAGSHLLQFHLSVPPPAGTVTINVASTDSSEVDIPSPSVFTFTTLDWNKTQEVELRPVDDDICDGSVSVSVVLGVDSPTTSDPLFLSMSADATHSNVVQAVLVLDDEVPALNVAAGSGQTIAGNLFHMEDSAISFRVTLSHSPFSGEVVVAVNSSDIAEGLVRNPSLTFTPLTWSNPQSVLVQGVPDGVADGIGEYNLTFSTLSTSSALWPLAAPVTMLVLTGDSDNPSPIEVAGGVPVIVHEGNNGTKITLVEFPGRHELLGVECTLAQSSNTSIVPWITNDLVFAPLNGAEALSLNPRVRSAVITYTDDDIARPEPSHTFWLTCRYMSDQTVLTNIPLQFRDNDEAGIDVRPVSLGGRGCDHPSELGARHPMILQSLLTSRPAGDVTITLNITNSSIIRFARDPAGLVLTDTVSIVITPDKWKTKDPTKVVTVVGVRDQMYSGDLTSNIAISMTSNDTLYHGISKVYPVIRRDILWPEPISISSDVIHISGGNLTVLIRGVHSGLFVSTITAINSLRARLLEDIPGDAQPTVVPSYHTRYQDVAATEFHEITLHLPPGEDDTYYEVSVTNPDGGFAVISQEIYYTKACLFKGKYSDEDGNCLPCVQNAVCPGGGRIWPKTGYWSPHARSPEVMACNPPEACIGGKLTTLCNGGYEGDRCSRCKTGFFRGDGSFCRPCSEQSVQTALIAIIVIFSVVSVFLLVVSPTSYLKYGFGLISVIQLLRIVTRQARSGALGFLAIFSLEPSAVEPGCSMASSFTLVFIISLLSPAILMGVFVLVVPLRRYILRMSRSGNKEEQRMPTIKTGLSDRDDEKTSSPSTEKCSDDDNAIVVKEAGTSLPSRREDAPELSLAEEIRGRRYRGLIILYGASYYGVTLHVLEAMHCVREEGKLVLFLERSTVCFQGTHFWVFTAAIIALATYIAVPTLYLPWYLWKKTSHAQRSEPLFQEMFGVYYESYLRTMFLWGTGKNLALLVYLVLYIILQPYYHGLMITCIVFLAILVVTHMTFQPFARTVYNIAVVWALTIMLVALMIVYRVADPTLYPGGQSDVAVSMHLPDMNDAAANFLFMIAPLAIIIWTVYVWWKHGSGEQRVHVRSGKSVLVTPVGACSTPDMKAEKAAGPVTDTEPKAVTCDDDPGSRSAASSPVIFVPRDSVHSGDCCSSSSEDELTSSTSAEQLTSSIPFSPLPRGSGPVALPGMRSRLASNQVFSKSLVMKRRPQTNLTQVAKVMVANSKSPRLPRGLRLVQSTESGLPHLAPRPRTATTESRNTPTPPLEEAGDADATDDEASPSRNTPTPPSEVEHDRESSDVTFLGIESDSLSCIPPLVPVSPLVLGQFRNSADSDSETSPNPGVSFPNRRRPKRSLSAHRSELDLPVYLTGPSSLQELPLLPPNTPPPRSPSLTVPERESTVPSSPESAGSSVTKRIPAAWARLDILASSRKQAPVHPPPQPPPRPPSGLPIRRARSASLSSGLSKPKFKVRSPSTLGYADAVPTLSESLPQLPTDSAGYDKVPRIPRLGRNVGVKPSGHSALPNTLSRISELSNESDSAE